MNDFIVTNNGKKSEIKLSGNHKAVIDGNYVEYEIQNVNGSAYIIRIDTKFYELNVKKHNDELYQVSAGDVNYDVTIRTVLQEKARELLNIKNSLGSKTEIKAPMPGLILKIKKQPGDIVEPGDSVLILEAMKMENDLRAPSAGKIKSIAVKEGNTVEKGTILFELE